MSNVIDLIKFGQLMLDWYDDTETGNVNNKKSTRFLKSTTIKNLLWAPQAFDEKRTQQHHVLSDLLNKSEKIYYGLGWMLCVNEDELTNAKKLKYAFHTGKN